MALSEDLPIHKEADDLLDKLIDLSMEMPRFFRYSLGIRMVDENMKILAQIDRANMMKEERAAHIKELIISKRQIDMMLRMCYNRKVFSAGRYAVYMKILDNIGRQATAWKSAAEKDNNKSSE
ncbi:MAG: four helix bundle protein [Bacteroidaceae bacterium]|nr:four helix bundle protein [Bacteroidaceae bacterium]